MNKIKSLWISEEILYDGSQLRSHFAYQNYGLAGNSIVSFIGPVKVRLSEMVDLEDVLAKESIASDKMLNFIIELFDTDLTSMIWIQRLFISILADLIREYKKDIKREGDDLFFEKRKLSVSIAGASPVSSMIHTALNITRTGTPISVACLSEMGIHPESFAQKAMERFAEEKSAVEFARVKVRWLQ